MHFRVYEKLKQEGLWAIQVCIVHQVGKILDSIEVGR